jgi:hypothetical protein
MPSAGRHSISRSLNAPVWAAAAQWASAETIPLGLKNPSNLCFLNSSLQAVAVLGVTKRPIPSNDVLSLTRALLDRLAAGGPPGTCATCASCEIVSELRNFNVTLKALFRDPSDDHGLKEQNQECKSTVDVDVSVFAVDVNCCLQRRMNFC